MSDCELMLQPVSSHCQGQCKLFITASSGHVSHSNRAMTTGLLDSLSSKHLQCPADSATGFPTLSCSCMSGLKALHPHVGPSS